MLKKYLPKVALIMLLVSILALIILAILVHYHSVWSLDIYLSRDIQTEGDSAAKRTLILNILTFVSFFGKTAVAGAMVVATATIFWLLKYYRETIFILLTPVAASINFIVKLIVDRPRPDGSLVHVLDREFDPSFPSGHVNFYVVFFGFLIATMFMTPKIPLWIRVAVVLISITMIISVSFSRIYLGAHWATDVLGGYLLGSILLSILLYFYLKPLLKSK